MTESGGNVHIHVTREMEERADPIAQKLIYDRVKSIVEAEGLENEYCLLFGGKVFFHSSVLAECDARERGSGLCFTRWIPKNTG